MKTHEKPKGSLFPLPLEDQAAVTTRAVLQAGPASRGHSAPSGDTVGVAAGVLNTLQFKGTPHPKINSVQAERLGHKKPGLNPGGKEDARLCAADHR